MITLPMGPYAPVGPVTPVKPVERRKSRTAEKSEDDSAATFAARPAADMTSSPTRAALDNIKLGG